MEFKNLKSNSKSPEKTVTSIKEQIPQTEIFLSSLTKKDARNKSQNALMSLEVITEREETRDKDATLMRVYESD